MKAGEAGRRASRRRLLDLVQRLEGERHPRTTPNALRNAEAFVARELERWGLEVERPAFRYRGTEHRNVVGRLPGRTPDRPRVLVGAHFDSARGTPGADDNASGVAVMLEVARLLADGSFEATVECVGFNLEEPQRGIDTRVGSRAWAEAAREAGVRYAGCFVLEMVGYTGAPGGRQRVPPLLFWKSRPSTPDFLAAVADFRSRALIDAFHEAAVRAAPDLELVTVRIPFRGWLVPPTRLSDHSRFWDAGYPALMLTDTAFFRNPHYHGEGDRAGTLDPGFMSRVAEATAEAVRDLAEPTGPRRAPEADSR